MARVKWMYPGKVLKEQYIVPMNLTLAKMVDVSGLDENVILSVISGNTSIDETIDAGLCKVTRHTPGFWLAVQQKYDNLITARGTAVWYDPMRFLEHRCGEYLVNY